MTRQQLEQLQALSKRLAISFDLAEASVDDEQKCRLYRVAFNDAKKAQALCTDPMLGSQRTTLEGIGVRAASGLHAVVARLMQGTSFEGGPILPRTGGTAGDQAARLALRHRMDLQLKQYADSIAEFADHEQFAKATLHDLDCGLAHNPEHDEVTRDNCGRIEIALRYMRGAFAAFAAAAHGARLRTYEWPDEVVQSLDAMDPIFSNPFAVGCGNEHEQGSQHSRGQNEAVTGYAVWARQTRARRGSIRAASRRALVAGRRRATAMAGRTQLHGRARCFRVAVSLRR
jgi:hypothetical protein